MAEATFRKGSPQMVAYTPASGALDAGDVVLLGNSAGITCGITHCDIANAVLGSIAVGGGIYDIISLQNNADYAKVYWDPATPTKVTSTSTNNALFGFIVEGGSLGANTVVSVKHHPFV
tara:strand:+ start:62 stop:418 length:357 start_codon:yes stop_codon:yes gene_type:complete